MVGDRLMMMGVDIRRSELPHVGFSKMMLKLAGSERIHLIVGSGRDEMPEAGEIDFFLGVFRKNVGTDRGQPLHAGGRDIFKPGIQQ